MKGVVSDGMLCSAPRARRWATTPPACSSSGPARRRRARRSPRRSASSADVVYDLAIEANRPDANCVAGVARDAAARLGLPFAIPDAAGRGRRAGAAGVRRSR